MPESATKRRLPGRETVKSGRVCRIIGIMALISFIFMASLPA
jgi:hypothetical protein